MLLPLPPQIRRSLPTCNELLLLQMHYITPQTQDWLSVEGKAMAWVLSSQHQDLALIIYIYIFVCCCLQPLTELRRGNDSKRDLDVQGYPRPLQHHLRCLKRSFLLQMQRLHCLTKLKLCPTTSAPEIAFNSSVFQNRTLCRSLLREKFDSA